MAKVKHSSGDLGLAIDLNGQSHRSEKMVEIRKGLDKKYGITDRKLDLSRTIDSSPRLRREFRDLIEQ